jgi:hypothetical protein
MEQRAILTNPNNKRIVITGKNGFYILDNDIRTNNANKAMEIFHERDFHHILENNSCEFEFIPDVFLYVYGNIN